MQRAFKRGFFYQRRIIQNSSLVRKLADDLRSATSLADAWSLLIDVAAALRFARLELVMDDGGSVTYPEAAACPVWTSDIPAASDDWSVVSVHLARPDAQPRRVLLTRSRSEEPLHSEFVVLVDVLSREFPRLLVERPAAATTS